LSENFDFNLQQICPDLGLQLGQLAQFIELAGRHPIDRVLHFFSNDNLFNAGAMHRCACA